MIWALKIRRANTHLSSYIPNNVNALITLIVPHFLKCMSYFLSIYLALPIWGLRPPPNPLGYDCIILIREPRRRVVVLSVP